MCKFSKKNNDSQFETLKSILHQNSIFHHQQMQQQNILTHYCNNISKSCKKRDEKGNKNYSCSQWSKIIFQEISYFDASALTICSYVLVKHLPMRTSNDQDLQKYLKNTQAYQNTNAPSELFYLIVCCHFCSPCTNDFASNNPTYLYYMYFLGHIYMTFFV